MRKELCGCGQTQPAGPGSIRAVELIDQLFLIDAQARKEKMDQAARHLLRQEKAPPLLAKIREHILATSKTVLPRSKAGQACNYTLALWKKLTCFRPPATGAQQ